MKPLSDEQPELIYRDYWLKRLDPDNVRRSLQGAIARSDGDRVHLMITTKKAVLPDAYDQLKIPDGGTFFGASTDGTLKDNWLKIFISGHDFKNALWFEAEAEIKLSEIACPVLVSYSEKGAAEG